MNLSNSFVFSISKVNRVLLRELDMDLLKAFPILKCHLTMTQLFTLMAIRDNHNHSITDISQVLDAERTTVSRSALLLRKKGLVKLKNNKEDKRFFYLTLTDEGKIITEKAISLIQDKERELSKKYTFQLTRL